MSKHTPGPWTYENDGFFACIRAADGTVICGGILDEGYIHDGPNACLIAAAPDFSTMAHNLEKWWRLPKAERTIEAIEPVVREALAAIAKAEEGQG